MILSLIISLGILGIIGIKFLKKDNIVIFSTCNTILYCVLYMQNQIKYDVNVEIPYTYIVKQIDFIVYVILFAILEYISLYDLFNRKIKNKVILYIIILGITRFCILFFFSNSKINMLAELFINQINISAVLCIIAFFCRERLGGGDLKLIYSLSFYSNLSEILLVLFLSCILGMIYFVFLLFKGKSKENKFAFGQCICLAFIILKVFI